MKSCQRNCHLQPVFSWGALVGNQDCGCFSAWNHLPGSKLLSIGLTQGLKQQGTFLHICTTNINANNNPIFALIGPWVTLLPGRISRRLSCPSVSDLLSQVSRLESGSLAQGEPYRWVSLCSNILNSNSCLIWSPLQTHLLSPQC